jgi:hypothetical protein
VPEGGDSSTPLAACCIPPLLHRRCGLSFFSTTTTHPPATSVGAVCCSSRGRAGVGLRPPAAGTRPGRPACISLLDEMRDARSTSAGICDSGASPAAAPSRGDGRRGATTRERGPGHASRDHVRRRSRRSDRENRKAKKENPPRAMLLRTSTPRLQVQVPRRLARLPRPGPRSKKNIGVLETPPMADARPERTLDRGGNQSAAGGQRARQAAGLLS